MLVKQDRWAWSYRMIAFDCKGRHKFAISMPVRRIKFSRPAEEDACEFEPEDGEQITGFDDLLATNVLSMGKSWTSDRGRTVYEPWEDVEYADVDWFKWMRLTSKERRTRTELASLGGMMLVKLRRQWKEDVVILFRRMRPIPAWVEANHHFNKWITTAIFMEYFTGYDELMTHEQQPGAWPEKFWHLKPDDRLFWRFEQKWRQVRVTKFGRRDPLFFEVVAGLERKQYPRFAMPDESADFWVPNNTRIHTPPDVVIPQNADVKATNVSLKPKFGFLDMSIPRERKLYQSAHARGMVELCLRRRGMPDRRVLLRKTAPIYKLRYSHAICLGYPMSKLKISIRGRTLEDHETPEGLKLEDHEAIDVELEPLGSPQ